jgi:hypothetical protein
MFGRLSQSLLTAPPRRNSCLIPIAEVGAQLACSLLTFEWYFKPSSIEAKHRM